MWNITTEHKYSTQKKCRWRVRWEKLFDHKWPLLHRLKKQWYLSQETVDSPHIKVARNEVKNASFAQRSAHHDTRIWRPELIDSAAERKRRAHAAVHFDRNWPIPTHTFCHSAIFHLNTPCNVWFFWVSRLASIILAKKMETFRADSEKFQEMCENLNDRKF